MRGGARITLGALLLAAWPAGAQAPYPNGDGARAEFLSAWTNIGAYDPSVADSPGLRRYPLYPWLQSERLRVELARVPAGTADPAREARITAFLEPRYGEPMAHGPYRDLLLYLGSRARWKEILELRARWPDAELPDDTLRCHVFAARLAAGDADGVRAPLLAQWLSSRDTPAACAGPYGWIDSAERLTPAEIEQRSRHAARERLPLPAAHATLPEARRQALRYWAEAEANPERALHDFVEHRAAPLPPAERAEGMVPLFERLARQHSGRAGRLFERLQRDPTLDATQRTALRRAYALGLAYDRDPEAVRQFARLPLAATDALAHEWRLRSALWHGDWQQLAPWLEELPPGQAQEPRWQYWRGRLHERQGDERQAQFWYAAAAKEREYYGFLAAERLGERTDLRHQPLPEDWPTLDLLAATPALRRARELLLCGLPDQATAEFIFALRQLPEAARPQMIRLAANWGWHERAVRLQAELGLWSDLWLRFPLPYDGEIEAAARDTRVPANWLYTVLRTESLYNPRARSRVGAQGLMQLMPATAAAVARRAGLKPPAGDELFRPEVNISLGARYLREMNDRFGGSFILTLAAYNAGPQRVPRWLPDRKVDGDIWVENIPFNETRTYVQRALTSMVMIGWRRSGEPAPILPLLEPVSART